MVSRAVLPQHHLRLVGIKGQRQRLRKKSKESDLQVIPVVRRAQEGGEQGRRRMPKRRYGKRAVGLELKPRQHHLYLIFDDWSFGYSIRKVNSSPSTFRQAAVRRLPRPFFLLEATHGSPEYFASAFGTRILVMHPRDPQGHNLSQTFFPMLGVRSRSITFGPGLEFPIHPIYFPVGNKLFILAEASFEMLCLESQSKSMEWSRVLLPNQPFLIYYVSSYASYGRSFLVSTKKKAIAATFSFDTESCSWKQLGNWALPFEGRGYFDPLLGAFVGLSKDPDTLGQLYFCYIRTSDAGHALESKLSKEKLFSEDPAARHVGATLVYMGSESKFCLVECISEDDRADQELKEEGDVISIEGDGADQELKEDGDVISIEGHSADQELKEQEDVPRPGCCLYRLTTFSLSHDTSGDPTTGKSRRVRYYKVPGATTMSILQDPVAFWM